MRLLESHHDRKNTYTVHTCTLTEYNDKYRVNVTDTVTHNQVTFVISTCNYTYCLNTPGNLSPV